MCSLGIFTILFKNGRLSAYSSEQSTTLRIPMKTICRPILMVAGFVQFSLCPVEAQLLDHVRALGGSRFPVGDPFVTVTNIVGLPQDGPKDVAVADLDGDGNLDFAASDKDGSVTVYFGQGNGKFDPPLYLRTWTTAPHDWAGYSVTTYITNTCTSVWTNLWVSNGVTQTTWTWDCVPGATTVVTNVTLITDGSTGLRGLAIADFTGDGRRDMAVASPGESLIYLLVNQGSRTFAPAAEIPGWFGVRDLAAGDFDGDGRIDLAAAGTRSEER